MKKYSTPYQGSSNKLTIAQADFVHIPRCYYHDSISNKNFGLLSWFVFSRHALSLGQPVPMEEANFVEHLENPEEL